MNLIQQIKEAGIVGCGGAGFPTHVKLNAQVEYFIVNGAECEPLLRTDRWLMCNRARELVEAAWAVKEHLGAAHGVIGLKGSYRQEIAALEEAIAQTGAPITLHKMESFYPAGDEQVLVREVTGRVVPPAGIPLDVGCVVSNAATMVCVRDAMEGHPFTWKYLTVTGAVREPTVLHVPLGTSFSDCIAQAGGTTESRYFVISGGPMMGAPMTMEQAAQAVVTKTTSGILVLPEDSHLSISHQIPLAHMLNRARSACIQCSYCTEMCPRHLMGHPLEPHRIMRKLAAAPDLHEILEDPDVRRAQLCCECGFCERVAGPMGLQPRRVNATLKKLLGGQKIRYPKGEGQGEENPWREMRKIPTAKAAARAGVGDYYHIQITQMKEFAPEKVSLPLRQHIGAPASPVVSPGDRVKAGQLIAGCPEGLLGADLHAPFDGRVEQVEERITIVKEDDVR